MSAALKFLRQYKGKEQEEAGLTTFLDSLHLSASSATSLLQYSIKEFLLISSEGVNNKEKLTRNNPF